IGTYTTTSSRRSTGSRPAFMSSEHRAGVVLDRASRSGRAHEQEAAGAQDLVGSLRLEPVDDLAALVGDRDVLVVLVLLILDGDHPVLQDPVEVGLHVVGSEQIVVVVLVLVLGALALAGANRRLTLVVLVLVLVLVGDLAQRAAPLQARHRAARADGG